MPYPDATLRHRRKYGELTKTLTPDVIQDTYQRAFGRAPSEEDIAVHMNNPGGYAGFLQTVQQSGEFRGLPTDSQRSYRDSLRRSEPNGGVMGRRLNDAGITYEGASSASLSDRPSSPWNASGPRPQAGDFSRTTGYDANNWGNMDSVKYRIGEIAARYKASPNGALQFLQDPDLLAIAPNVRNISSNGKNDLFDFGGIVDPHSGARIGRIDMGISFDPNNPDAETKWGWQDLDNTDGATAPVRPPSTNSTMPVGEPVFNEDGTVTVRIPPELAERFQQRANIVQRRRPRYADFADPRDEERI
jgi:hypothetical protein